MNKLHFNQDSKGNWYRLPVALRSEFMDCIGTGDFTKYDKYRCLHPCNYMFDKAEVLKGD
jgi:hypothetical protein